MNKLVAALCAVFLSLYVFEAWCVIPSADWVLAQVFEKNPVKNIKATKFNAIISHEHDKQNKTLELKNSGLSLGKEALELYAFNILLKSKSLKSFKDYLGSNGVDLNVVSLGFFGNEPAYIIGAQPGDTKSAQLWIEKTSWIVAKEIGKNHEIIFENYEASFPRLITIKRETSSISYTLTEILTQ